MTFLTIDQKDEETWFDQGEDKGKDKDIGTDSDTVDYSGQIEKL